MELTEQPETPFQRFVLLAVADLARDGEAPVHSFDVRQRCMEHASSVTCAEGGVERAAVVRALESLADDGLLTEVEMTSPVGKGRPGYALDLDPDEVVAAFRSDDAVGGYATAIGG